MTYLNSKNKNAFKKSNGRERKNLIKMGVNFYSIMQFDIL